MADAIHNDSDGFYDYFTCSECNEEFSVDIDNEILSHCPHCGEPIEADEKPDWRFF